MITSWTRKIPKITAKRLNCSSLIAIISGTAKIIYLKYIEPRDIINVLPFDFPILNGRVSPIRTKLTILKTVPRINPFPMGF
jgi:hypothetical protein